jgi:phosphoserine aminotransferase
MVPLNLTVPLSTSDYLDTGHWSKKAIDEARRYCAVRVAAELGGGDPGGGHPPAGNPERGAHQRVPQQSELTLNPQAAYVHYTPNETISGVEFYYIPQTRGVPLIADMSSNILSRPIDVSRFGLIYAGAQKNIGPSGLTVVIVHEDLLGRARPETPSVFNYKAVAESHSMLNTPPTFAWYVAGLVFKWLKKNGGLTAMGERNRDKARALYGAIDGSALYRNAVAEDSRSSMNVTFTFTKPELEAAFVGEAAAAGLHNLKGHRALGGMRASLYNAMPLAGVQALIGFMHEFERKHL